MKRAITAALAATLMATTAAPVMAQSYTQRNDNYVQDRAEYERQLRTYEASRARYERDRAAYDRRYGAGAYERYYGGFRDVAPVYRDDRYDGRYDGRYDDRYADGRYDDRYGDRYAYDPYAPYANSPCERRNTRGADRTGGTVLGALVGGALGAVAAGDSSETEGAILGAIVGGAIGNSAAGSSNDRAVARCDSNGYYYTYDQTIPYRENGRYRNGRYDESYYARQRCRLAAAPYDGYGQVEYRYVRVCPDRNNRYRITS